jgi:hypothetical protein
MFINVYFNKYKHYLRPASLIYPIVLSESSIVSTPAHTDAGIVTHTKRYRTVNLLEIWFRERKGSIVAYSDGIDSILVLFLARKFQGRKNAIGVISNSES